MNRYGSNLSPDTTPATVPKKSVSPSSERTFTFVLSYNIVISLTVSLGRPKARSVCDIFPLFMKFNAFDKSTNKIVTSRFFALTPKI